MGGDGSENLIDCKIKPTTEQAEFTTVSIKNENVSPFFKKLPQLVRKWV